MRYRLFGPLRVRHGTSWIPVSAAQQRTVLAVLLIEAGQMVATDRLIGELWGERPPESATSVMRGYLLRLRRLLGTGAGGPLLTRRAGYELLVDGDDLDCRTFERLAESGCRARSAGRPRQAVADLSAALELSHGRPLADVPRSPTVAAYADRLDNDRLAVVEDRITALLELGEHRIVVGELQRLVAEHPFNEGLWANLMLALHRSGRRGEALDTYQRARAVLAAELGLEPGRELTTLQRTILAADGAPLRADVHRQPAPHTSAVVVRYAPRELPPDVHAFTGRDAEVGRLARLLSGRAGPMVVAAVTGSAGVGKTALAVHVAHRVARRYPDAQLHIDLRGHSPDPPVAAGDALGRLLRSLGMAAADVPDDLEERTARYRSLLAGRRALLILDNAASAEQVRPLLPGSPSCAVLVTSRDDLSGLVAREGARRVRLDVLGPREAITLLRRLIGTRVDREPDAVATILRCCARLPLALRLTAELVTRRPTEPLMDLAESLRDLGRWFDVLNGGPDQDGAVPCPP